MQLIKIPFFILYEVKGDFKTFIECKKYSAGRKVGVDIVRSLYGTAAVLEGANALLATTSYFSRDAKSLKASRYDLELRDFDDILQWVNEYRPHPNGDLFLREGRLVIPGDEGRKSGLE